MSRLYFLVAFSPISAAFPFENGARAKCSAIANWISVTTPSCLHPLVPLHPCETSFHPFHGPHRTPCIQWLRCGAPTSFATRTSKNLLQLDTPSDLWLPSAFSRWSRFAWTLEGRNRKMKLNRRIGNYNGYKKYLHVIIYELC